MPALSVDQARDVLLALAGDTQDLATDKGLGLFAQDDKGRAFWHAPSIEVAGESAVIALHTQC